MLPRKRHEELKKLIHYHNERYHVHDQPEIPDYEYDKLFAELLDLEKNNPGLDLSDSPSLRVGGQTLDVFERRPHRKPMLSLTNSYSAEDLTEFDARVKKFLSSTAEVEYFCE